MNTDTKLDTNPELPLQIKEQLIALARRLPEAAQSQFVRSASARLVGVAKEYPRTIVFTAAGWILGEIIDNILTINIPLTDVVVCLTADRASDVGGVAGALYGFFEDKQKIAERRRVGQIIGEELKRANATVTS